MNRVLLLGVAVLLLSACKGRQVPDEAPDPAAVNPSGYDVAVAEGAEQEPPPADEQPTQDPETAVQAAPADATKPARDLAAELQAAVGTPLDCLQDYRPASSTVVRVDITAIVRPSGLIIEPSANGRGLSTNDRRCIEKRIGDVVLAPLDAEVSETVSTHLELDHRASAVEEANVGAPTPKLENVVHPLPKQETLPRSGTPIDSTGFDRPDGPKGTPIDGPKGERISGPRPRPIDGYEADEDSVNWTD